MKRMFATILIVAIVVGSIGFDAAHSQGNEIPEWIKSVAGFWAEDRITDSEFIGALEFLIEQGIIHVDDSQKIQELERENADLRQRIGTIGVEDEVDNPIDTTRGDYVSAKIKVVAKDSPVDFVRMFLADSDKLSTKELIDYVTMTDWLSESEEDKTLLGMEEEILYAMTVGRLSNSEKMEVAKMLSNARAMEKAVLEGKVPLKVAVTKMLDSARVKPMHDVSYDNNLVRRNLDHVGDGLLINAIVLDAVDRSGDADRYDLLVSADKINLVPQDSPAFVIVSYAGPRILAGDYVRVVGTVTGLEIRDKDYLSDTIRIESGDKTVSFEQKGSVAGEKTQLQIPAISASSIQILKNPTEMDAVMLKDAALEVPHSLLKENSKSLAGSVVYYEGLVSSVNKDRDGNLQEFRLDVNQLAYEFDAAKFLNHCECVDLSRHDDVGVYGVVMSYTESGDPVLHALGAIIK